MNPLNFVKSLIQALQGGSDPRHAAAGFALGAALGLVPKNSLFSVVFILIFFLLRVDKGMALASAMAFTPLAYALDGLAHSLGYGLLTAHGLAPLWTWLYNLPIVPWTRFNNTVVMGNLVLGILLFVPLYLLSMRGILYYQANWSERVAKMRLVKAFTGLSLVSWYLELTRGR
jgi:uncharacterized protein (TIGR03546 family)